MLAISCAHFRRNRAAVVHSVIQPFFQRRSAPADGNAARDDLPVCDESLRAMAKACVGRRTTDDALHSGLEYALPRTARRRRDLDGWGKPARPQTGYCLVAGADWDGFSEANPVSDVGVRQYRVWHEIV